MVSPLRQATCPAGCRSELLFKVLRQLMRQLRQLRRFCPLRAQLRAQLHFRVVLPGVFHAHDGALGRKEPALVGGLFPPSFLQRRFCRSSILKSVQLGGGAGATSGQQSVCTDSRVQDGQLTVARLKWRLKSTAIKMAIGISTAGALI